MTSHVLWALPITPLGSSEKISELESNPIIVGSKSIEMENNGYEILETNSTMLRKFILSCTYLLHQQSTLKCSHALHLSRGWEDKVMLWL
jgi:hypothetical protein